MSDSGDTTPPKPDRTPSLKRSLAYVFGGRFMRAFIQVLTAAVIARLLTPEEMGTFAVASAAIAISTALAEFGISPYLVQTETISKSVVGRAFSIMIMINWAIAVAVFAARGPIGVFYDNAAIEPVMSVLAIGFLLNPFVTIGTALLMRELRYGKLTMMNLGAGAAGSVTSVGFALADFGPISLAFGAIMTKVAIIIGIFLLRPDHLSFYPRFRRLGEIAAFGSWAFGSALIKSAGRRSPELIIGRVLGLDAAGLFDRGMTLTRLVNQQIAGSIGIVLTPFFAEEKRKKADLKERFIVRLQASSVLIWPIMVILAGCSYSIVLFLFGSQWTEAAPVAAAIAIPTILPTPFSIGRQFLMAQGRVRDIFGIDAVIHMARVVAVLIFVKEGLVAVALSLFVPAIIQIIMVIWRVNSVLRLAIGDWWRALAPSAGSTAIVGAAMGGHLWLFGFAPEGLPIYNLLICGSLGGITWLISLWAVQHPVRSEIADMGQRGVALLRQFTRSASR